MQMNLNSHALYTDHYEFTMLDALVQSGQVDKKSVFEVFVRELPLGRPFGVFAGINRLLPYLKNFFLQRRCIAILRGRKIISKETQDFCILSISRGT